MGLSVREKTKSRGIRLPVSEWALIEADAGRRGVKVNEWCRMALLSLRELELQRVKTKGNCLFSG